MELNDELIKEMGKMAELQFSDEDIALIVEMDIVEMKIAMEDESSKIYKAVMGGRLRSEAELRQVIIKLSKQGSSPAQTLLLKMVKDRERRNFLGF